MQKIVFLLMVTLGAMGSSYAAGDAAAGKTKSVTCGACHGPDGNSMNPIWPKLAGQHASYIRKQLEEFKAGKRKDPMMSGMAMPLTEQDQADLAAYFSGQSAKPGAADAAKAAQGKRLYLGGNMKTGVAACVGCHGANGQGNPAAKFPALQSQQAIYVAKQLKDFRAGTRSNDLNGMMQDIARKMSDAEIEAVAQYVTSM